MSEWSRRDGERHRWENREVEWSFGKSDIEGKAAREAARERGRERVSNGREHMSQCGKRASFNLVRPRRRKCILRRGPTLQQTAGGDCDVQTLATPSKIKPAAFAGFAKLSDNLLDGHLAGGLTIDGGDLVTGLEACFRSG